MWFQMILDCIIWPSSITVFFENFREDDVDESDIMDVHRVTLYLKTFIENGTFDCFYCDSFNLCSTTSVQQIVRRLTSFFLFFSHRVSS